MEEKNENGDTAMYYYQLPIHLRSGFLSYKSVQINK